MNDMHVSAPGAVVSLWLNHTQLTLPVFLLCSLKVKIHKILIIRLILRLPRTFFMSMIMEDDIWWCTSCQSCVCIELAACLKPVWYKRSGLLTWLAHSQTKHKLGCCQVGTKPEHQADAEPLTHWGLNALPACVTGDTLGFIGWKQSNFYCHLVSNRCYF